MTTGRFIDISAVKLEAAAAEAPKALPPAPHALPEYAACRTRERPMPLSSAILTRRLRKSAHCATNCLGVGLVLLDTD